MSDYITNNAAQKDFVYDLFSPKDDLSIYHSNPLEYMAVVRDHLENKKLRTYSLPKLIKVEDQFKTAYSLLSDELKNEHLDFSDAANQLFDLQVEKTEGNKNKSLIAQDFLSPKDNLIDYLDPLDYIAVVKESITAGKMDKYSLTELQEVEDKFSEAYAQLSDKKKEIYQDDCVETIWDLSKLYVKEDKRLDKKLQVVADLSNELMDNADEGIETILYHHALELKKEKPQDYHPGHAEISVEEQDIDADELNDIITLEDMDNLLARYNPNEFEGYADGKHTVISLQKNASKDYCVTYKPFQKKKLNYRGAYPKSKVFNDGYDLDLSALKLYGEDKAPAAQIEYDVDVSEFYVDAPQKSLENIVVAFPSQKKSKALSFLAKAAIVVGLGFGVMGNYDALNQAADTPQKAEYHGTPSAEVASPTNSAKASVKSSETKKVEKETSAPAPRIKNKFVKRFPPSYKKSTGTYHSVEKGETLAGLYEDYAAHGGTLSRSAYFRAVSTANPQIENISTIYVGQVLDMPN